MHVMYEICVDNFDKLQQIMQGCALLDTTAVLPK
jgi:hypothetical protein